MRFVGRQRELAWLDAELERVRATGGRLVALRGRRQVGKSRLVTEWLARQQRPFIYYQALNRPVVQELEAFAVAVGRSNLGAVAATMQTGVRWTGWEQAFEALALAADTAAGTGAAAGTGGAPADHTGAEAATTGTDRTGPIVVVLDELPYLTRNDPSLEATLQAVWDHRLQYTDILLIVIGSDLNLMAALGTYDRPLYQRIDVQRQIQPLDVAAVAELLGTDPVDSIDTALVTGGFPKVVAARAEHPSTASFLTAAVQDEAHPLIYTGEQMLAAEFPPDVNARAVLSAIGSGARSWSAIASRSGITARSLQLSLEQLLHKGVISADDPTAAGGPIRKRTRYRVADPYLRFWLRFIADRVPDIARGRGDLVLDDLRAGWQSYAGPAVEPLVHDTIARLLPDPRFGEATDVGAFWTRDHRVEVDLVGTGPGSASRPVAFVGSVKWREVQPFGRDDLHALRSTASELPGWDPTTTRLVGVSRTGFDPAVAAELDVAWGPEQLLAAWTG